MFLTNDEKQVVLSAFTILQDKIHAWAKRKGWWRVPGNGDGYEPLLRPLGDQFANFHAEISEAWEEYRTHGNDADWFIYDSKQLDGPVIRGRDEIAADGLKPEGIAVELADTIVRILDTCGAYKIPLAEALFLKLDYNDTRPDRHGGKHA